MRKIIVLLLAVQATAWSAPPPRGVPAGASGVAVFAPSALSSKGGGIGLGFGDAVEDKEMGDDLRALARQRLGLELDKIKTVTMFYMRDGFATILTGATVASVPPRAGGGLESFAKGDVFVFGEKPAVAAAQAVLEGRAPGLAPTSPVGALLAGETAPVVIAADLKAFPEMRGLPIDSLGLTYANGKLRLIGRGDDAAMKTALGRLNGMLDDIEREMGARRTSDDTTIAMSSISGYHMVRSLRRQLKPEIAGGRLSLEIPVSGNMPMMVGLVGIVAAVAIPAFMKNAKKAKTVEAIINVKKMSDGARAAAEANGGKLPAGKVGPTPALGACCGTGGRCAPQAALWTNPIWRAIGFSLDDPHYYSYSYESDGTTFTARANGDLNCNGVYSTFEMTGKVGQATPDSAGMFKDKEFE